MDYVNDFYVLDLQNLDKYNKDNGKNYSVHFGKFEIPDALYLWESDGES